MNTKNNSLAEQDHFNELIGSGAIRPVDYGIITDGLCATPEDQDEFDKLQKGKPPATE